MITNAVRNRRSVSVFPQRSGRVLKQLPAHFGAAVPIKTPFGGCWGFFSASGASLLAALFTDRVILEQEALQSQSRNLSERKSGACYKKKNYLSVWRSSARAERPLVAQQLYCVVMRGKRAVAYLRFSCRVCRIPRFSWLLFSLSLAPIDRFGENREKLPTNESRLTAKSSVIGGHRCLGRRRRQKTNLLRSERARGTFPPAETQFWHI